MNGKHHLVAAASVLGCAWGAASIVSASFPDGVASDAVQAVSGFFMDGCQTLSLHTAICLAAYLFGTLLPDIDSPGSMLGKYGAVRVGHRTWTHSLWPALLLFAAGWFLRPLAWMALGYVVHLFWDSLSRMGVCWFYPYPGYLEYGKAKVKRNHWVWLYHNGTVMETVTCYSSMAIAVTVLAVAFATGSPM